MSNSNIVRGAMLLTAASFISKFLGMIYVIPFHAMVGEKGGALYQYAYIPYSILITVATVGIPLAVSKFVSKYNSLNDYYTGMRMFRTGMSIMAITGTIAFLGLFFGAEALAKQMIPSDDLHNSVEDVTMVIRMVSFALIITPSMSIFRGFFQGNQSMGPTAVSQVVEQIVRIIFLLTAVFLVLKVFDGELAFAVGLATFAAFLGAIASYVVLLVYWKKRKPFLDKNISQQKHVYDIPKKDLMKELFRYAGPFVIVSVSIPLFQFVDNLTFSKTMVKIGRGEIAEIALAGFNLYGHKLVIIPVSIATGLSLAVLPAITSSFTQRNQSLLYQQINQSFQVILTLVIPAVVGLSLLSTEAYGALYGLQHISITGPLLGWYAFVGLFYAMLTVSSSILQGINQQNYAVIHLIIGLLVKILFNIQFIYMFGQKGAIFATALAAGVAVALNCWRIKKAIEFPFKQTWKRTILIIIFVLFMAFAIWITKLLLGMFIAYEESRFGVTLMLIIGVVFGGGVYLWLAYASTLLERVFGEKVRILDKLLKRK
ncbi:oligosaccharide flippase family protein [Ornithinibacillus salinisoli]|uniref:Oligosaccharide flippase family protein n=1 Tax=Ornithinibacillus salinisoli TaxID=1848459 RepID=A0ABW4W7S2_9BACI